MAQLSVRFACPLNMHQRQSRSEFLTFPRTLSSPKDVSKCKWKKLGNTFSPLRLRRTADGGRWTQGVGLAKAMCCHGNTSFQSVNLRGGPCESDALTRLRLVNAFLFHASWSKLQCVYKKKPPTLSCEGHRFRGLDGTRTRDPLRDRQVF